MLQKIISANFWTAFSYIYNNAKKKNKIVEYFLTWKYWKMGGKQFSLNFHAGLKKYNMLLVGFNV